jgi:hypothetical protein
MNDREGSVVDGHQPPAVFLFRKANKALEAGMMTIVKAAVRRRAIIHSGS